jgi:cobyrinic acid a,c-diamide synthase
LALANDRIKGHEFHYSTWDHPLTAREAAYTVVRRGAPSRLEGFVRGQLLASYLHVHFLANRRWAQRFVACARQWQQHQHNGGRGRRVTTP